MTRKRFREHFSTGAEGVLIVPAKGKPRRLDGKPLTTADLVLLAGRDPVFTLRDFQDLGDAYSAKFDNLPSVSHPSIICEAKFYDLMRSAVERGRALTQKEVENVFGPISWEW